SRSPRRWPPARPGSPRRPPAVEVDDPRERRLADPTEGYLVASEHDAVLLGPEVAARLVHRSLERPHLPRVLVGVEDAGDLLHLQGEERVPLRRRAAVGADLPPLDLDGAAERLELLLPPRRRNWRAWRDERLPLELRRILQRGHVRLPRLDPLGGREQRGVRG